ncbi:MAG: hypothetical protein ABI333_02870 [bacterium]
MAKLRAVNLAILMGLSCAGPGCGDDSPHDQNNNTNDNQAADAGVSDASIDAGPGADAGADAAVATGWVVTTDYVQPFMPNIAAHPTDPSTVALLGSAEDWYPLLEVWLTTNGADFDPTPILSFTPVTGMLGTPMGLAFDPADGDRLVGGMSMVPPPQAGQEWIHIRSDDGGSSFTPSTAVFTNPWPPDELRFVGGTQSELIYRAGQQFHFSTSLGAAFERTADLDPLPVDCDGIAGFDVPADDHDTVAIWCDNGNSFICSLAADSCTLIPIAGQVGVIWAVFAPSNPALMFLQTNCDCGWGLFRSTDGGLSTSQVYSFEGDLIRVAPNDEQRVCALHRWNELHCSKDGGGSWSLMTPSLAPPVSNLIHDFAFGANGGIWAVTLNEVIHHPPW